jgi:hypothetical protein
MQPPADGRKGPDDPPDATVESPAAAARERAASGPPGSPSVPPAGVPRRRPPSRAWVLALAADAMQWALLPVFAPGFASPANVVLDLAVCALMVRWCGWHWAFLPSVVAELVPFVDLVPTWTAAVWIAGWGADRASPRR